MGKQGTEVPLKGKGQKSDKWGEGLKKEQGKPKGKKKRGGKTRGEKDSSVWRTEDDLPDMEGTAHSGEGSNPLVAKSRESLGVPNPKNFRTGKT